MLPRIFWILAFFGAIFGGMLVVGSFGEDSAPKQAASAAVGCGFAVVPYVVARAIQELGRKP